MTTESQKLIDEYLRLGGKRKAKVDDNIVNVRQWEDEPAEAESFWQENIAPLEDKRRRDVEILLPSINDL